MALASRNLLLVLDNCEHLADDIAALVAALRARAPNVRLLVTSQELLKCRDEHVYRLGALAVPASAHVEDAGFSLTGGALLRRSTGWHNAAHCADQNGGPGVFRLSIRTRRLQLLSLNVAAPGKPPRLTRTPTRHICPGARSKLPSECRLPQRFARTTPR